VEVLVIGLVLQGGRDLFEVELFQSEHAVKPIPGGGIRPGNTDAYPVGRDRQLTHRTQPPRAAL
jgi:hypothetical protein